MRRIYLLFLILATVIRLPGQHIFSPPSLFLPDFSSEFTKRNTEWDWHSRIQKSFESANGWNSYFSETLMSSLNELSTENRWKDEHRFNGYFTYTMPRFDLGLYAHSWIYADKQISTDDKENHIMGAFGRYKYKQYLALEPYFGRQNAKNRAISDWGWDLGIQGNLTNIALETYDLDMDIKSDYDLYDNRSNYDNNLDLTVHTEFSAYTQDSIRVSFKETKNQHYSTSGRELLKFEESNRLIENKLLYRVSPSRRIMFNTLVSSANLSYRNDTEVFRIENQIRYFSFSEWFIYGISLQTHQENRDVTGTLSDNNTSETALGFNGTYLHHPGNRLQMNFTYVKKQYDTPEGNTDDRDEQRFILNMNYFYRFSHYLDMEWMLYTYMNHLIYISAPQSQNNKWNRIIKLQPAITYRNGRLSNKLKTSVLANYSVYDFDEKLTRKTSFIIRKYSISDSLLIPVYKRFSLVLLGRLELEDKGNFFKARFEQKVVQSYQSQLINIHLVNERIFNTRLSVGYSYFVRRDWRHIPDKKLSREITNSGPFINIIYANIPDLRLSTYLALSVLDDSRLKKTSDSKGYLKLYYNF